MFAGKRIFRGDKRLVCYICTSPVRDCYKSRKGTGAIKRLLVEEDNGKGRKGSKYPEVTVSPAERENAKKSLNALLEDMQVKKERKEVDNGVDLRDMLKVQIDRKNAKQLRKKNLGELVFEAAEKVAKDLGGDAKKTKEDLLERLKMMEVTQEPEVQEKPEVAWSEPEMKGESGSLTLEKVFLNNRLGIFEKSREGEEGAEVKLNIWERLEEEELAYMLRKPPRNELEEWILWTEQGKLWHFPIDNDQGMEKEAEVEFTQHVFLEQHLEPWCPKVGPLKKFMDLVLVGLSKNPYLTVEDKKEHIFWYRDYFEKKKQLLQELGAFGAAKGIGESASPRAEEKS